LRHMSFVESSSAPDLSSSLVTVDLTYIIIYSTTTTIGLTSIVVGWTSAATNRASYDNTARSSYKVSRARIKQPLIEARLALPGKVRQSHEASKCTKYTLNILDFFEIDGKRYNMGGRPLRRNT
jgi:hypothetical protein